MRGAFLIVLLCGSGALAQSALPPSAPAPTARLFVTVGAAARLLNQPDSTTTADPLGFQVTPTVLHASAAYFFLPWLGVDLEARGELFYAYRTDQTPADKVTQVGFGVAALPSFRWSPAPWLDVEAQLGWGVVGRPVLSVAPNGSPQSAVRAATGPATGLVVGLEPLDWLSAQLFARAEVPVAGAVGLGASLGTQLRVGSLRLGDQRWGVGLSYEFAFLRAGTPAGTLEHFEHRFGVGIALLHRKPPPPPGSGPTAVTVVSGRVSVAGTGAPISGAVVELTGWGSTQTDATGAFTAREVAPGTTQVRVTARGFKTAARDVTVSASGTGEVQLTLEPPTGPGRVRGVVQAAPDKPLAGALVRVDGGNEVKTGPDGSFAFDKAGPGPITLTAAMSGYEKGEEVIQVPPEALATLTFTLKATGLKTKATVKGLVVGTDGQIPKTVVRVVELKKTVTVKADGRFELEVPGGRYTLVLQAKGYLSQTKVVEVADGDQAIFHAELEKVTR